MDNRKPKHLAVWPLLAAPLFAAFAANSPVFLPLAWDPQPGIDAYYVCGTNTLAAPLTLTVTVTNSFGTVFTNQAPGWPTLAVVPGNTNYVQIPVQAQAQFMVVFASNVWGLSLPSNILNLPAPGGVVTGTKAGAAHQ